MFNKVSILILLTAACVSCTNKSSSTSLYKAKGGKQNTPYDDNRTNNKELKAHQKKARERQKELDHINHKDLDPSHPHQGK